MTTNDTLARSSRIRSVQVAGRLFFVAGLVGLIQAVVVIGWPADVPTSRYSYPFNATDFVVAQLTFFAQDVPLVLGFLVLAASSAYASARGGRIGLLIAGAALALLGGLQLVAIGAASTANDSTLGNTLHILYLVPVVLLAVGAITAGISVRRSSSATGSIGLAPIWLAWLLIAIGVYVVVPMSPMLAGPFILGQLGIGGLMLLFAVLGGLLQSS